MDHNSLSAGHTYIQYIYTVYTVCIYCIYIFICIYKLCLYDSFTLLWWAQLQRTLGQGISPVSYFGPSAEERRPNSSFNPQAQFGGRILCSLPANQHRRPSFDGVGGDSRRLPPATRHTSADCIFSVCVCGVGRVLQKVTVNNGFIRSLLKTQHLGSNQTDQIIFWCPASDGKRLPG